MDLNQKKLQSSKNGCFSGIFSSATRRLAVGLSLFFVNTLPLRDGERREFGQQPQPNIGINWRGSSEWVPASVGNVECLRSLWSTKPPKPGGLARRGASPSIRPTSTTEALATSPLHQYCFRDFAAEEPWPLMETLTSCPSTPAFALPTFSRGCWLNSRRSPSLNGTAMYIINLSQYQLF